MLSVLCFKGLKISASGQELGGEMLFQRRLGFSGTPSDLLPLELGRCHYERGSDGKMLSVLTSPDVVSLEVRDAGATDLMLFLSDVGREMGGISAAGQHRIC